MEEYNFWPDVLDGLKEMFTRTQFAMDQGGYFPQIKVRRGGDVIHHELTSNMDMHNTILKTYITYILPRVQTIIVGSVAKKFSGKEGVSNPYPSDIFKFCKGSHLSRKEV